MSDIALYYETSGQGEALILLHGNGESHSYFCNQIPFLSERFTVYALDTRGHGQSPMGEKPFTLSQFADDLRDWMDERGIRRAHVLGFSDGANIAMLFAIRNPERLLSLVLNSGNLDPSGLDPAFIREITGAQSRTHDARESGLLKLMTEEPHIDPKALSVIHVPTLVIAGTDDLIPPEHTRLIANSIQDAKLVFLRGTHAVAEEDPGVFNAALAAFYHNVS